MSDTEQQVIVVGSGLSGVAVVDELVKNGVRCLLLEAGKRGETRSDAANIMEYREAISESLQLDQKLWAYESSSRDYDWIRVRAAGGRSLRWSGWIVRPGEENFRCPATGQWSWPIEKSSLDSLLDRSERWRAGHKTELTDQVKALADVIGCEVKAKIGAVTSNEKCPLSSLDRLDQLNADLLTVQYGCIVTRILHTNGALEGVLVKDANSGQLKALTAKAVVLCLSPIETARLLLESGLQRIAAGHENIGKNYCDHIAASYLAVIPDSFVDEMDLPGPLHRSATVPRPWMAKRSAEQRGGFTLELSGPNPVRVIEPEVLVQADLIGEKGMNSACFAVNAIGELCSSELRYVTLSDTLDSVGRRIPRIVVQWDKEVRDLAASMEAEALRVAQHLCGPDGQAIKVRRTLSLGGTGVSHESGTCRMGSSPEDSVVDVRGQVFGVPGLFVGDASQMPTALDCHPTLTIIALSMNTADGVLDYVGVR